MSLQSKIEAVIYASEEPVTLQQLVGLLAGEAQAELDELALNQAALPLDGEPATQDADENTRSVVEAGTRELNDAGYVSSEAARAVDEGEVAGSVRAAEAPLPAGIEGTAEKADEPGEATPAEEPPAGPEDGAVAAAAPDAIVGKEDATGTTEEDKRRQRDRERAVRDHIRRVCDRLMREYAESDRGIEIREVASGFRMGTKPEYHDAVRGFVKSLKPALKLTLPALETLAVVAYKQPVTAAEISEVRGVDSAGVLGGLMTRKLIATAGRKQVIGRPMLYKTTRDFLLRFGLKDVNELPSMEEFERMAGELAEQEDLPMEDTDAIIERANARGDADMIRDVNDDAATEADPDTEADSATNAFASPEAEGIAAQEEDTHGEATTPSTTEEQATAESAAGGNDEEASHGNIEHGGRQHDTETKNTSAQNNRGHVEEEEQREEEHAG